MSKPFARIVLDDQSPGRRMLFVGEQFIDDSGELDTFGDGSFEGMVERINAAVEERERQLHGALQRALDAFDYHDFDGKTLLCSFCEAPLEHHSSKNCRHQETAAEARAALGDDPPEYVSAHVACGLAFDLGMALGHVEGTWGVLFDALSSRGGFSEELRPLVTALGLLRVRVDWIKSISTVDLTAEIHRRGMFVFTGLVDGACHGANGSCGNGAVYGQRYCREHLPRYDPPLRVDLGGSDTTVVTMEWVDAQGRTHRSPMLEDLTPGPITEVMLREAESGRSPRGYWEHRCDTDDRLYQVDYGHACARCGEADPVTPRAHPRPAP